MSQSYKSLTNGMSVVWFEEGYSKVIGIYKFEFKLNTNKKFLGGKYNVRITYAEIPAVLMDINSDFMQPIKNSIRGYFGVKNLKRSRT